MNNEMAPILVVEDSPEDFEATVRAIHKADLPHPIVRCEDGDEALDFLFGSENGENRGASLAPSLILLDLNLPGTSGREVLAEIKQDLRLRLIPVIVFTTSSAREDIDACYLAGANSYVQKPLDSSGLVMAMKRLKEFWFGVVVSPHS